MEKNKTAEFSAGELSQWCSLHKYSHALLKAFPGMQWSNFKKIEEGKAIEMLIKEFGKIAKKIYDEMKNVKTKSVDSSSVDPYQQLQWGSNVDPYKSLDPYSSTAAPGPAAPTTSTATATSIAITTTTTITTTTREHKESTVDTVNPYAIFEEPTVDDKVDNPHPIQDFEDGESKKTQFVPTIGQWDKKKKAEKFWENFSREQVKDWCEKHKDYSEILNQVYRNMNGREMLDLKKEAFVKKAVELEIVATRSKLRTIWNVVHKDIEAQKKQQKYLAEKLRQNRAELKRNEMKIYGGKFNGKSGCILKDGNTPWIQMDKDHCSVNIRHGDRSVRTKIHINSLKVKSVFQKCADQCKKAVANHDNRSEGNKTKIDQTQWNDRFQAALAPNEKDEKEKEKYAALAEISAAFSNVAGLYGEIIISESYLQLRIRSIISEKIFGGVAGGIKILTRNILFKICEDPTHGKTYTYGLNSSDYELAAKSAGHDIKGAVNALTACVEAKSKITTAMMSVIDHLGLRATAMPLLPLDKLLYGSDDVMVTVHCDRDFHSAMTAVAQEIHLAEHNIGKTGQRLYTAGDVEGHLGKDTLYGSNERRRYLIDTARVFPPEYPLLRSDLHQRGNVCLYRLLRPEFLQSLKKKGHPALNADVWTGWSDGTWPDRAQNIKATFFLLVDTIREFVEQIEDEEKLTATVLHKFGINARHIALLRQRLECEQDIGNIFIEMITRTIKNNLRSFLRKGSHEGKTIPMQKEGLVKQLSKITRGHVNTNENNVYWEQDLFWGILLRFGSASITQLEKGHYTEKNKSRELITRLAKRKLLGKIIENALDKSGISLSEECKAEENSGSVENVENVENVKTSNFNGFLFSRADIKIISRLKQFDTMDHALGKIFENRAVDLMGSKHVFACDRLFQLSAMHYRNVMAVAPLRPGIADLEALSQVRAYEQQEDYVRSARKLEAAKANLTPEVMKTFTDIIIPRRHQWRCCVQEVKELMWLLGSSEPKYSTPYQIFKYAQMLNKNVKFVLCDLKNSSGYKNFNEFEFKGLIPNDINYIMSIPSIVRRRAEIPKDLSPTGLSLIGKLLMSHPEVKELNIGKDKIMIDSLTKDKVEINKQNLNDNEVRIICGFLGENTVIKTLDLSGNNITDEGARSIADLFLEKHNDKTLEELKLDDNPDIKDRGFKYLADALRKFKEIKIHGKIPIDELLHGKIDSMALVKRNYRDIDAIIIASMLQTNNVITNLDLRQNFIGVAGSNAIVDLLMESKTIKIFGDIKINDLKKSDGEKMIDLSKRKMGDTEAILLGEILKTNTNLQVLDLQNNLIGDAGAVALAEGLHENKVLRELDLRENTKIGNDGENALFLMLHDKNKNLEQFSGIILNNLRGIEDEKEEPEEKKEEHTLNLAKMSLGNTEAIVIARFMAENTTIKELNLANNKIGDRSVPAFTNALRDNTTLERLNMNGNVIKEKGAKLFGDGLKNTRPTTEQSGSKGRKQKRQWMRRKKGSLNQKPIKITIHAHLKQLTMNSEIPIEDLYENKKDVLNLQFKGYKDTDALIIAALLEGNDKLSRLDLSRNQIGDRGAMAIADAFKVNFTLTKVNLAGNKITNVGAKYLGHGLKDNHSLKQLQLDSEIPIEKLHSQKNKALNLQLQAYKDADVIIMCALLEANKIITSLDLSGNTITDDGAEAVGDVLIKSVSLTKVKLCSNDIANDGAKKIGDALMEVLTITKKFDEEIKGNDYTWGFTTNIEKEEDYKKWRIKEITIDGEIPLSSLEKGNLITSIDGKDIDKDNEMKMRELLIRRNKPCKIGFERAGNTTLTELDMRRNNIGSLAAQGLGDGLGKNSTLIYLNLGYNEVDDIGATSLGKGLENNITLEKLYLYNNNIGNPGGDALNDSLAINKNLQHINLEQNRLTRDIKTKLKKTAKDHKAMIGCYL